MAEFAGVAAPAYIEGASLRPLIAGDAAAWREELVYEYYWDVVHPQTPTTFALRTDDWNYIFYHGIWNTEELYHLKEDPSETRNLANAPAHRERRDAMRARLFEKLRDTDGERNVPYEAKAQIGRIFRDPDEARGTDYVDFYYEKPRGAGVD